MPSIRVTTRRAIRMATRKCERSLAGYSSSIRFCRATINALAPPAINRSARSPMAASAAVLSNPMAHVCAIRQPLLTLDRFAFKTPTLRNVALTAPYMHNGAFQTLEEAVDFYSRGGGQGIGISLPRQTLPPEPLQLTASEKQDIFAFMKSLTDTTGLIARPAKLPVFPDLSRLNRRGIGGKY